MNDSTQTETKATGKPSADRMKRARKLIEGNPTMRHVLLRPMGLETVAAGLPTTRRERRAEGTKLKPAQRRSQPAIAHPLAVDHFLKGIDASGVKLRSGEHLAVLAGGPVGLTTVGAIQRAGQRAIRFMRGNPDGAKRMPRHIRAGAVLSSAIVQAIAQRFPEQLHPEALAEAEAVRARFLGPPAEPAAA